MGQGEFDAASGHRFFSSCCFNATWELLDQAERTEEDNEQMRLRAMASLWHWTQRADVTPENLSVGYWLVSRVHAVAGCAAEAVRYGELALAEARRPGVVAYALAYAHEALALAHAAAGDDARADDHITLARRASDRVGDAETRRGLLADLGTISRPGKPT